MKKVVFNRSWVVAATLAALVLVGVACSGPGEEKQPAGGGSTPAVSAGASAGPSRPVSGPATGAPQPVVANGAGQAVSAFRSLPPVPDYGASYGYAYNAGSFSTGIVVSGVGMKAVQPDIAKVYLGVEAREKTVAAAREAAAQAMSRVRDALKGLGVAEKDIVTTSFTIQPETIWVEVSDSLGKRGEPRIIGYVVQNQVEITVRKLDDVGKVVDTAAEKGGDLIRVNSINFTLADPNTQAVAMRELAAKDARAKAEIYARAMGVNLGQLAFLSEVSSSSPVVQKDYAGARAALAEAAAPTPITPGEIDLATTITAVFAIGQ